MGRAVMIRTQKHDQLYIGHLLSASPSQRHNHL